MSASIYYHKVKDQPDPRVRVGAPSSFISAMEAAFGGGRQWTLEEKDLPTLRGMAAVSKEEGYEHLIELVEKLGAIEVWYQY